jgi:hypothetical protein
MTDPSSSEEDTLDPFIGPYRPRKHHYSNKKPDEVSPKKMKSLSPQQAIDEFWKKFDSKAPGKGTSQPGILEHLIMGTNYVYVASTILPKNVYARKASEYAPRGVVAGKSSSISYDEAAAICKAKVAKIVQECRRVNQKYSDPHFDIEFDLKWGKRDCLETLEYGIGQVSNFTPQSVKRVEDIFDKPSFYVAGATSNDIRQGRDGDCWLMAGLAAISNKEGLIEKVCVERDEQVGVYGFVFYRDGEWRSEIIDDKLYLTKPDYDESFVERALFEDRERIRFVCSQQIVLKLMFLQLRRRISEDLSDQLRCLVLCAMRGSE